MRTEPFTTLKRQATELLADLERSRQPILITQHGLPSAYLVDVETYELMQQRMNVLEGIARGEQAVAESRVLTHDQAKKTGVRVHFWEVNKRTISVGRQIPSDCLRKSTLTTVLGVQHLHDRFRG